MADTSAVMPVLRPGAPYRHRYRYGCLLASFLRSLIRSVSAVYHRSAEAQSSRCVSVVGRALLERR